MVASIETEKMRFLYISIKDSASLGVPWNPGGITLPMLHKGSDTHSVWESQPRALAWYYHSHCLTNGFTNVRNVVSDINQPTAGNMEQVYRTWMRSEIKSAHKTASGKSEVIPRPGDSESHSLPTLLCLWRKDKGRVKSEARTWWLTRWRLEVWEADG